MIKIIIKDLDGGMLSKPVDIDWLLFGADDLEFENGDTLPLNDFKFFRKEYEIMLHSEQEVKECDATMPNSSNEDGKQKADQIKIDILLKHGVLNKQPEIGENIYSINQWLQELLDSMEEYKNKGADIEGLREKFYDDLTLDDDCMKTDNPETIFNWFKTNIGWE